MKERTEERVLRDKKRKTDLLDEGHVAFRFKNTPDPRPRKKKKKKRKPAKRYHQKMKRIRR